jgi:hypothetical protein
MYHLTTINTDGSIEEREQTKCPDIEQLQEAVGGYVESVPYWQKHDGKRAWVICNEEGKLHGLPVNCTATLMWHDAQKLVRADVLVGNIVIVACDTEGEYREL